MARSAIRQVSGSASEKLGAAPPSRPQSVKTVTGSAHRAPRESSIESSVREERNCNWAEKYIAKKARQNIWLKGCSISSMAKYSTNSKKGKKHLWKIKIPHFWNLYRNSLQICQFPKRIWGIQTTYFRHWHCQNYFP